MKKFILLLLSFFIFHTNIAQNRPNIIVFLVDDMGWQDTSVPFWKENTPLNKRYHTPAMQKMANCGVKFSNAYATPVCTPTRTSLLTGMNAAHHGITNWTSPNANTSTDNKDDYFTDADWNYNGLNPAKRLPHTVYATTFPQILKQNGYYTIHVGKAHWGPNGTAGANPYNLGFMVNIAGSATGHPQSYYGTDNYGNIPKKATVHAVPDLQEYYGTETFLSDALTTEALKAIEEPIRRKQPFFLNLSHYAVHVPIQPDKRFLQKYLDAGLDSLEAAYATLVEGMDKSLGDVMNFLEKKSIEKNTIIIFMSDNGGLSLKNARNGGEHTQNKPLKAGKGSVYEGGIRVPMIVRWDNQITRKGTTAHQPVMIDDFFPTIMEMAQIKSYQTIQQIDGKSFLPILKNPNLTVAERSFIWHYPNKWIPTDNLGINYHSAIRKGDWKLIYNMKNREAKLFNLNEDIGEENDLASKNPKKVAELKQELFSKLKQWKAPMPMVKSTGKPFSFDE